VPDELVVLDGSTFFVSDRTGDVEAQGANGFFFADTRHLSSWRLHVDGHRLRLLTSRMVDYYSAFVFGTLTTARVGLNPPVTVRRDRFVSDGVREDFTVENSGQSKATVRLELFFEADFADIFEIKEEREKRGRPSIDVGASQVTLRYERDQFRRATLMRFTGGWQLSTDAARATVELGPRESWRGSVEVDCLLGDEVHRPVARGPKGRPQPKMPVTLDQWMAQAPALETGWDDLQHTYRQSMIDLAALRFRPSDDLEWSLPAAGLPWFMALFGRDSALTSYQALPFQPHLAAATLNCLARLQATEEDDFRDAEPGKILHELRCGELATLREVPHTPYYGTHDATPLFLILLDEYERWTGDLRLVQELEPSARAALDWMERHGDRDGDGYLEYKTRSPRGLRNQGWKDSWNSMLFADGRLADPPIAPCEVQGYAYDARRRAARLARTAWGDRALAERLDADAERLKDRFNRDFWNDERGHYVLALDADKHQVDSMTSNAGQLLWTGIVEPDRARGLAGRLLSEEMFSGWGIRTMSPADNGYNPIEYHNGTVWPHDTALIAEGLRRYGFREEASALAVALIEAAPFFAYRLPEVFAGFDRASTEIPVEYPTACRPQAWSAGTPLLAMRTLLGFDVVDGRLESDPCLPARVRGLALKAVPVRGSSADLP
jgi:glycogen debranching enzyme